MTELELYAFRKLPALAAAQELIKLSRPELVLICTRLALKHKPKHTAGQLRELIMGVTHPVTTDKPAEPLAVQIDLFGGER